MFFNRKNGKCGGHKKPPIGLAGYEIGAEIDRGNFGTLYRAVRLEDGLHVAIKVEDRHLNFQKLDKERKFYEMIHVSGTKEEVAAYFGFHETIHYNYLVIELLGPSLECLLSNSNNRLFTIRAIIMIAINCIKIMEVVHKSNIIYRDMKPDNILTQVDQQAMNLRLVDFGLSQILFDEVTGRHVKWGVHQKSVGTLRYMSINSHLGIEQSRRDDMESLGYVFFYLLRGSLPWQGLKCDNQEERNKKISAKKQKFSPEMLCGNLPAVFATYLHHVRCLEFEEEPKYDQYLAMFLQFFNENFPEEPDVITDWPSQVSRVLMHTKTYSTMMDYGGSRTSAFTTAPSPLHENIDSIHHFSSPLSLQVPSGHFSSECLQQMKGSTSVSAKINGFHVENTKTKIMKFFKRK